MPKAFSETDRERIRAKLIQAGRDLLNRIEIRMLVVEDLAREAGISKGSFYSFFPSREDFLMAVFESWETEFRGELLGALVEGTGSPRQRWESFFRGAFVLVEREPGLAKIGTRDVQLLMERLPPDRIAAHQAEDRRVMEETAARLAASGILDPKDLGALPGLMASVFLLCLNRAVYPPGTWEPSVGMLAEALALRLAAGAEGVTHG